MRMVMKALLAGGIAVAITVSVAGQVHVSSARHRVDRHDDQDRARHGPDVHAVSGRTVQKGEDAQVKAGFQKSYKILRTMDDGGAWNMLILREYANLAALEANVEKADALLQQTEGSDQVPDAGISRSQRVPRSGRHEVPRESLILK